MQRAFAGNKLLSRNVNLANYSKMNIVTIRIRGTKEDKLI